MLILSFSVLCFAVSKSAYKLTSYLSSSVISFASNTYITGLSEGVRCILINEKLVLSVYTDVGIVQKNCTFTRVSISEMLQHA